MNYLYNSTDAQIQLTSNEGWGLALTEAILAGNPIIANVTGGMQDQMRFEDDKGNWVELSDSFPSNHKCTYKKCGKWAFPVFPSNISIAGSPPTPYIFDDRCSAEDAAEQILNVYNLKPEERKSRGLEGRKWALSDEAGFTSVQMTQRVIDNIDNLLSSWEPREKYNLIKVGESSPKTITHNLEKY
jgi:hypothetical protein